MPQINLVEFHTNGKNWLYNSIKAHKQENIPDDFRLEVLYNEYDIFNDLTNPGIALVALHEILSLLDFPLFFVTITTTNTNIHPQLLYCVDHFTNEIDSISYNIIPGTWESRENDKDTLCILPWIHTYVNPQGQVGPCCEFNDKFELGNINDDSLENIINNEPYKKLRLDLLNKKRPDICNNCWSREDSNLTSRRLDSNRNWKKFMDIPTKQTSPDGEFTNFKLKHLDIRLSNVCNFMCRMCSGKFSNKIANEENRLYGSTTYLDNLVIDKSTLLTYIENNLDHIESVYFAGGEPILNQEHYKILDIFIDNKLDVAVTYNTNFSMLRFKDYNLLDYWSNFTNVQIGASIDVFGKQANYIRHGAEYEVLEQNYHKIKDLPNIKFKITSILHLMNAYNLPVLQKHWLTNLGLSASNMRVNTVITPNHLQLTVLPEQFKQELNLVYEDHISFLSSLNDTDHLVSYWTKALKFMNSRDDSYMLPEFFRLNDNKDRARNQNFEEFFPEFSLLRSHSK